MNVRIACFLFLSVGIVSAAGSQLANLSVRSTAGTGAETLIVGFAIGGNGTKPVLIRGVGPTLSAFDVPNVVSDPVLSLYSGTRALDQNDNWGGDAALASSFRSVGAFDLPATSRDAAMLKSLPPGTYSAQLLAPSGPGVALVECYDTALGTTDTRLINVSARSMSGAGEKVLTVGFAIVGDGPETVLIRGIGPTLGAFGVTDTLPAPRLRLFNSKNIEIGDGSGWLSSVSPESLFDSVGAFELPSGSDDAVLFFALPPGTYSAQLSGLDGGVGNGLIEVYEVTNSPVSYVTMQPTQSDALGAPFDAGAGMPSAGPDTQAAPLIRTAPVYPFELRKAAITGEALVDFFVKSDGTTANAVALWATDYRLGDASVAAIRNWTFTPGRKNGKLVTTHFQQPVVFSLTP